MPHTDIPSRLAEAEQGAKNALRQLAHILRRARLDPSDVGCAGDLLLEAGFPEDTPEDTHLLDLADAGRGAP